MLGIVGGWTVSPALAADVTCTGTLSTNVTGTLVVPGGAACTTTGAITTNGVQIGNSSQLLLGGLITLSNDGIFPPGLTTLPASSLTFGSGAAVDLTLSNSASGAAVITNDGSINLGSGNFSASGTGGTTFTNRGIFTAARLQFGSGIDALVMQGGTITAAVDQGDGDDRMEINGGVITGDVRQGNGIDLFRMTGGQISSLAQGNGRDVFVMSGGWIVGGFDDGDVATLTGGRIGRVDMKLDNNIFTMSGGQIDGNLVAGFGNDTFSISGGSIGGNISVSGGTDSVTITGGQVSGEIRMSLGNDTFLWADSGNVLGLIDMGPDNDIATLRNLSTQLSATAGFQGGLGNDFINLDNSQTDGINRFAEWESVQLLNGSRLSLDGDLVLGDSSSQTGSLSVDATSSLIAVSGVNTMSISPFTPINQVTLTNAGSIDLTPGEPQHRLTINGAYVGAGGTVGLGTQLGGSDSPTDRLIVNAGSISGSSLLAITNQTGAGGYTLDNGILLVQSTGDTISTSDAFRLQNRVRAGAYEYYLYKGGVSGGTAENWYLRSSLPVATPSPSPTPTPTPEPTPPQLIAPPAGAPDLPGNGLAEGGESVPIYRSETPLYALLPALGRDINLFNLATFHDRRGDQGALGISSAQQVWSRIAVSGWDQSWGDTSQPEFNGNLSALNLGVDLGIQPTGQGGSRRWGAMFNIGNGSGSVKGLTYATENNPSGSVQMQSYGFSLYGTLVDPSGWYVDAVGGLNWLKAQTESQSGINTDTDGWGWTISLETGYPIKLGGNWSLEPELQLIGTGSALNGLDDGIADISFKSPWTAVLRSGVRLAYQGRVLQPFLRANFWTNFSGDDGVTYDSTDTLSTSYGNTTIQLGAGVTWQINQKFGIEASIDYLTQSQNSALNGVAGNLQLRLKL